MICSLVFFATCGLIWLPCGVPPTGLAVWEDYLPNSTLCDSIMERTRCQSMKNLQILMRMTWIQRQIFVQIYAYNSIRYKHFKNRSSLINLQPQTGASLNLFCTPCSHLDSAMQCYLILLPISQLYKTYLIFLWIHIMISQVAFTKIHVACRLLPFIMPSFSSSFPSLSPSGIQLLDHFFDYFTYCEICRFFCKLYFHLISC